MSSPHPVSHRKPGVSPPTPSNQISNPSTEQPAALGESPLTKDTEGEALEEVQAEAWLWSEEEAEREALWAGKIMVDNTRQFKWIVYLKEGIERCFANRQDIFVAGDLAWLPDASDFRMKLVPDAMVVVGRPPHDRSSYKQWEEENIPPQVVFEVISPSNNATEMQKKRGLYEAYGVEEFYLYDPALNHLSGYVKGADGALEPIGNMEGWKSPRLGIRFRLEENGLRLYTPEDKPILSASELMYACLEAEAAQQKTEAEKLAEQHARQQAEAAQRKAEAAQQQAESQLAQLQQELDALRKQSKRKKTKPS